MKDNFSSQSEGYAKYRPRYPKALFEFICNKVPAKNYAWDVGTGNGQSAAELSSVFQHVIATDISEKQLSLAPGRSNISYRKEPAERTSLPDGLVDLVTVSQALHWFDLEKFYKEVRRVAAPGAMIAVWTYGLLSIAPGIDEKIRHFHFEVLKDYWDEARVHVDNGYSTIPFPFKEISSPPFYIETDWTLDELEGYLNTWSAVLEFTGKQKLNPVPRLIKELGRVWAPPEKKKIRFPIRLKMAHIH